MLLALADEVVHSVNRLMAACGTNRPNEDVRIQCSFRRDNGHATDIARRQNLTHPGHRGLDFVVTHNGVESVALVDAQPQSPRDEGGKACDMSATIRGWPAYMLRRLTTSRNSILYRSFSIKFISS